MTSGRAMAATLWSASDVVLRQGLQLAVTIVLARLLTPTEFGTVALLALFVGVAGVVVDGGFSTALIQRQDITRSDECTVFWINVVSALVMAFGLAALGPALASFFDEPVLQPLAWVMAASVLVNGFSAVHVALLTKALDFRPLLTAGLTSSLVSGGVAILLAFGGAGVWSLAAQILVSAVVTTALLWMRHSWRPDFAWSAESARRLGGFGGYVFVANLSDVVFTRSYTLLVGKLYGARDVGIYSRADSTQQLPVDMLNTIFGRVALPVFSESAGNVAALRTGARTATNSLMLLNVPLLLGVAVVAEPLVQVLFGQAWSAAAPLLQILCLAGTLWPLHVINLQVLLAQGRSRLFLKLEVAKKLIGLVLLALASTFGLVAIAWSQVVFGLVALLINAHYSRRFLDYGAVAQMRDVVPIFAAAVPSVIVGLWLIQAWDASAVAEIVVVLPVCAAGFALMALLLKLHGLGTLTGLMRSASGQDAES